MLFWVNSVPSIGMKLIHLVSYGGRLKRESEKVLFVVMLRLPRFMVCHGRLVDEWAL